MQSLTVLVGVLGMVAVTALVNVLKRAPQKKGRSMYHFATALIAGITIAVLISGGAAAKMSASEREALEKMTAACKAEAEDMKFRWHWRKRQRYVQNCIIRSASEQGLDIEEVRKRIPVNRTGENAF